MMGSVTWLNRHPDICHPLDHWDTAQIQDLLESELVGIHDPVFVVAGRFHASEQDVNWVWDQLPEGHSLLIVTSDEEGLFPYRWHMADTSIKWPSVWVMTPTLKSIADESPDVILGHGPTPRCVEELRKIGYQAERTRDVFFAGQVTHSRRDVMWAWLQDMVMKEVEGDRIDILGTDGFAQGWDASDYYTSLARAKIAPSPSGPCTADSFRTYEALTAGALPIVDDWSPRDEGDRVGWWERAFPGHALWPIRFWDELPGSVEKALKSWPREAVRSSAWWSQERARLRHLIREHSSCQGRPSDITILVSTSPSNVHPSVDHLKETVESALAYVPDAEIVIVADGVREDQEGYRQSYEEYLHHVAWLCNVEWDRAQLIVSDTWRHQAGCVKLALEKVHTPMLLMMEHDTPFTGTSVNMGRCERVVMSGEADVIRFSHEGRILDEHEYLMLGEAAPHGLSMIRTRQWSQRPHLASTTYYRDILERYFGIESKAYIEDEMYGVVSNLVRFDPHAWYRHRIWIYNEPNEHGYIQHSYHLDGRGDDAKSPVIFAYDGQTPSGAPAPTAERDD